MNKSSAEDVWPAPPRTLAKDKLNIRLSVAYGDFTEWARQKRIEYPARFIYLRFRYPDRAEIYNFAHRSGTHNLSFKRRLYVICAVAMLR